MWRHRFCKLIAATAIGALLFAIPCRAELIVEEVRSEGHAVKSYVAVFKGHDLLILPARAERVGEVLRFSADAPALDERSLVSGVVLMSDGRVESSPLHPPGPDEISAESSRAAAIRIGLLNRNILMRKQRLAELENEMELVAAKLRRKAGLTEVERIYDRIAALQRQADGAVTALEDIETARRIISPRDP